MQKKFFLLYLAVFLSLLLCTVLIIYTVDSERQFSYDGKKSSLSPFTNSIALTVAGSIKHAQFETIVLGTSSVFNFNPDDMTRILQEESINCHVPASNYAEHQLILNLLSQYKPSTHIIYAIDWLAFNQNFIINECFEDYAYKNKFWELHRYFFATTSYQSTFKILKEEIYPSPKIQSAPAYGRDEVLSLEKELPFGHCSMFIKKKHDIQLMKHNFDSFLHLIERNPQNQYTLIFPPYSVIWWLLMEKRVSVDEMLEFKKYVIEKSAIYSNVEIFDFQTNEEFITNLDNYIDYFHITRAASLYTTQCIKQKKHLINAENILNIYNIKDIMDKERAQYKDYVEHIIEESPNLFE